MAIITNSKLTKEIGERLRPRAETVLGLQIILQDDLAVLSALGVEASEDVIDDGSVGPIDFTRQHFVDYVSLIQDILIGGQNPTLLAAIQMLRVRALDVIIGNQMASGTEVIANDPVATALKNRIRPRAKKIRATRFAMQNDVRVMTAMLEGYADEDLVDDGRSAEGLAMIPIIYLKVFVGFMAALIDPSINTEARGLAVDAACTEPLSVN